MSPPSTLKPLTLYGKGGPNPPKIAILLAELHLPHDVVALSFADVKQPDYLAINPNGRMPSLTDPNFDRGTGITVWESGAIVEYLVETYDQERRLSFAPGTAEAWHAKQWLFFQVSGQGPYYGQAAWFKRYHAEPVPSAVSRYVGEVNRITGVLESWLSKQASEHPGTEGPYLVGNRLSFADLAFVPYQHLFGTLMDADEYDVENYPHVKLWLGKMMEREAAKTVMGEAMKGH